MIENNEVHAKIIKILEDKGPSLPIQIAKEIGMSSLFISAFLSEMVNQKRVKMSHLKVGSAKLYLLPHQDILLEKFAQYLNPKEAEALILLKEKKLLKDSEQEPSIRVALRSIRDFAIGFKKDGEIFWRYVSLTEQEAIEIINKSKKIQEPKIEKPIHYEKPKPPQQKIPQTPKTAFQNPLAISPIKKTKPKSEFVQQIVGFINKNNYKIIQEKDYKTKEYNCILQIKTELGPMNFLTQAKDKKTISETDIKNLLGKAQTIPLPAFILYTGKMSKKAQEFANEYFSVIKAKKIE